MKHAKKGIISSYCSIVMLLLSSCNKTNDSPKSRTLLVAIQRLSDIIKVEKIFKIYEDSSYIFTEMITEFDHKKTESWEGVVRIHNDTIKFFPSRLGYNHGEIAVLKNGFIELINAEHFDKLKIQQTSLFVKNRIDFANFKDYAVFTAQINIYHSRNKQNFQNYDLTTKELAQIDSVLKQDFQKKPNLREFSNYIKQVEAVRNTQGSILAFIHCFCKNTHRDDRYQYYPISIMDGGNCNVFIKLNLSTRKIETLTIAGET